MKIYFKRHFEPLNIKLSNFDKYECCSPLYYCLKRIRIFSIKILSKELSLKYLYFYQRKHPIWC